MRTLNFLFVLCVCLICANCAAGESPAHLVINSDAIPEASGVAVSRRDPDLLWVHNDSGDWATLYAVTTQGKHLGSVDILGANAVDWEDIAAFEINGEPWLLIADVGDNFGVRPVVSLYLLPEPDITGQPEGFLLDAKVARRIDLRFEDGPRDVEAVAVDAAARKIYLLSKRDDPPVLYCLPLEPAPSDEPLTLAPYLTLANLPGVTSEDLKQDRKFGRFRHQASALDISADGTRWLITTYKQALIYEHNSGQSLEEIFAVNPRVVALPQLPQIEAGGLSADGSTGYFISEKLPAQLVIRSLASK